MYFKATYVKRTGGDDKEHIEEYYEAPSVHDVHLEILSKINSISLDVKENLKHCVEDPVKWNDNMESKDVKGSLLPHHLSVNCNYLYENLKIESIEKGKIMSEPIRLSKIVSEWYPEEIGRLVKDKLEFKIRSTHEYWTKNLRNFFIKKDKRHEQLIKKGY